MPPYAKHASLRLLLAQARYDELEATLEQFRAASLWNIEQGEPRLIHAYKAFGLDDIVVREQVEEWLEARPRSYQARTARAYSDLEMGMVARGGKWARETSDEQFRLMRRFLKSGEHEARQALKLQPRNIAPHRILVIIGKHSGSDRFAQSVKEALEAFPESHNLRANAMDGMEPKWHGSYELMERFAEASQQYADRNPALKSLLGDPWTARGDALRFEKRYDEAIEMYTKALEFGEELDFLSDRSLAARRARRYDLAIRDGKRAMQLYPWIADYPETALSEALASARSWAAGLYGQGSLEEAHKVISLVIDHDPNDAAALNIRGVGLCQMRRTQEGVADAERVIALEPDNEHARQVLWTCYATAGNYQEAIRRQEAYLLKAPGNAAAQYDAAALYLQLNDPGSAAAAYRVACRQEYRGACGRLEALLREVRAKAPPQLAAQLEEEGSEPHPQERLATIEAYDAFMEELEASDEFAGKPAGAVFRERPSPRFPAWAMKEASKGTVTAHLYVRADGTVAGVKILSAEPAGFFELAALRALLRWRLEPTGAGYKAAQRLDFVLGPETPAPKKRKPKA